MIKRTDAAEISRIVGSLEPRDRASEIAELRGRLEGARITASGSSTPTVVAVLAVGGAITVTTNSHDLAGTIILLAATLLAVVLTGLLMREHKSALNQVVYLTKLIALHEQAIRIETSRTSAVITTPDPVQRPHASTSDASKPTPGRVRRALHELRRPS